MNYYDQHLHTFLSFDSEEQFENYLAYKPDFFVATDHFDLENSGTGFKDDIPDYHMLTQKILQLNENYPTKILRGIELGVVPGQEQRILDYLEKHPYDLKLLSIHQNGRFDYMDDQVLTMDKFAVAKMYFDQMDHVLASFPVGDILTHFEYSDFPMCHLIASFLGLPAWWYLRRLPSLSLSNVPSYNISSILSYSGLMSSFSYSIHNLSCAFHFPKNMR